MEEYAILREQISMIQLIVKSTDEILPVLQSNEHPSETILQTMTTVLKYMNSLIERLPEILISETIPYPKKELINSLNNVIDQWCACSPHCEKLSEYWEEFFFWWREFRRNYESMVRSERTIVLSMN